MEYLIGVILALAVVALATVIGLDRGRGFYPTLLNRHRIVLCPFRRDGSF